jgi:hypothetical protein
MVSPNAFIGWKPGEYDSRGGFFLESAADSVSEANQ